MFTLIFGYLDFTKYLLLLMNMLNDLLPRLLKTFITCHVTATGKVNRCIYVILGNQSLRILYTEINHLYLADTYFKSIITRV